MPIRTRIDMQATGINTPVGIKIAGPDLDVIESLASEDGARLQAMSAADHNIGDKLDKRELT